MSLRSGRGGMPGSAASGPSWSGISTARARSALAAILLMASCLTAIVASALAVAPAARADTVPPPPSGWSTVFSDNFAGAAGSRAVGVELVLRHRHRLRHR